MPPATMSTAIHCGAEPAWGRGSWRFAMLAIIVAVAAAFVVLLLVNQGHLDRGWAYAVIPVAIVGAAASRVLTIFKAAAEDKTR